MKKATYNNSHKEDHSSQKNEGRIMYTVCMHIIIVFSIDCVQKYGEIVPVSSMKAQKMHMIRNTIYEQWFQIDFYLRIIIIHHVALSLSSELIYRYALCEFINETLEIVKYNV